MGFTILDAGFCPKCGCKNLVETIERTTATKVTYILKCPECEWYASGNSESEAVKAWNEGS